jgi:anti-sigma regulatory factor (Ser/Thr protein kinase)
MREPEWRIAFMWLRHIWRTLGMGLASRVSLGRLGDPTRWRLVQSGYRARQESAKRKLPRVHEQLDGPLPLELGGAVSDLRTLELGQIGTLLLCVDALPADADRWAYVEAVAELFCERLLGARADEAELDVWTYVVQQFLLNAVQHGHEGDWSRRVELDWKIEAHTLTVEVRDEGMRPWGSAHDGLLLHLDMPVGGIGVALDYARGVFMDHAEWGDRTEAGRLIGHRQMVSSPLGRSIDGFWSQRVLNDIVRNDLNARRFNLQQFLR